jgi:hypothetical protein
MKRQNLETVISACLPEDLPPGTTMDVLAWELWGNRKEGFEVNDGWKIARETDLSGLKEAARGRWEVFKVNYFPRARVSEIDCHGGEEWEAGERSPLYIEYQGTSFLEIRFNLPPVLPPVPVPCPSHGPC